MDTNKTNKILFVIANSKFQDDEYFEVKKILNRAGYEVDSASAFVGEANGKMGGTVQIDMLFSEIDALLYDAIVYIGGSGAISLWDDWRAHGIAKIFLDNEKLVCAIGSGCVILANAGLLNGVSATCLEMYQGHLRHGGADCIESPVAVFGNIITAQGSAAIVEFANTIVSCLK